MRLPPDFVTQLYYRYSFSGVAMRNNTCTLGIVILLCFGWCLSATDRSPSDVGEGSGLIFEALAVKPDYVNGETVELSFKLHNVGHNDVLIARTFQLTRYIDLQISNQHDEQARWCGRVVSQTDSARSFTVLAPGESVKVELVVSCVNRSDPGRAWGYALDKPGKYVIKATYRLPQTKAFFEKFFPNVHAVRGPIAAKPVTIEIE